MIDPTRIAAREKNTIGILMVPGACTFSIPINPPRASKITPKARPTPLRMFEIIFFTPFGPVLTSTQIPILLASLNRRKCLEVIFTSINSFTMS
jgi:hypothetical protein